MIEVDETKKGLLAIRKTDKKKPIREVKEEEEIEYEIEYEEGKKKKIKKVIKAKKPDLDEELIEEDTFEEFKPEKQILLKSLPFLNAHFTSEAVSVEQPTEIETHVDKEQKIKVTLLPHSAILNEEVRFEEDEQDFTGKFKPETFNVMSKMDTMESIEVTEQQIQMRSEQFDSKFVPQTFEATKTMTPSEGVLVSEVMTNDEVIETTRAEVKKNQAKVTLLPKEATVITETETSLKEETFAPSDAPKTSQAEKKMITQEGVTITEVQEVESEKNFEGKFKPTPVKSNLEFLPKESITVSETIPETKTEKYLPEQFVATEVATKGVRAHFQITTQEMNLPETEGEYVPGRLPPSQTADLEFITKGPLIVTTTVLEEKEKPFATDKSPETYSATPELTPLEGVKVTSVKPADKESTLIIESPEKKTADVEYLEKKSLVTQITTSTEKEGIFVPGQKLEGKKADSTITCLETSNILETVVQEKESDFVKPKTVTPVIAEKTIRPGTELQVSEIVTGDAISDFTDVLKYRTETAVKNFETKETAQQTITTVQEKEKEMMTSLKMDFETVEESFNVQQSVIVQELNVGESEGIVSVAEFPDKHNIKFTPTHPLQSLAIEETLVHGETKTLTKEQPKGIKANLEQDALQETQIQEIVTGEELGRYDKDFKPDRKVAEILLSEEKQVTVTEVIAPEKEGIYEKLEGPEKHKIKPTPTHPHQPLAVEETLIQGETKVLSKEKPQTLSANVEQDVLQETLIQEVIVGEGLGQYSKDFKPDTKKANVELSEDKSLIVTEMILSEKEGVCDKAFEIDKKHASFDISPQTVAISSSIHVESSVGEFHKEKLNTESAHTQQSSVEGLMITLMQPVETEGNYVTEIKPDMKKVSVEITEGKKGISVTQIISQDKESPYEGFKPQEYQAGMDISPQVASVISETKSEVSLGNIDYQTPSTAHAKPDHELFTELTVTESMVAETEQKLIKGETKDFKKAQLTLLEEQGVFVTEVVPEQKEHALIKEEKPTEKTAQLEILEQSVALKEEIVTTDNVDSFKRTSPTKEKALPKQEGLECAISQIEAPAESEGVYVGDLKPDKKRAETEYEEAKQSLFVTEVTLQDKEKQFVTEEKPDYQKVILDVISREVAETGEIKVETSLAEMDEEKPTLQKAKPQQTLQESLILSETAPGEKEGELMPLTKPEEKSANWEIDEKTGLSVSEVIVQDKEKDEFVGKEKPKLLAADTSFVEGVSITVSEVIVQQKEDVFQEREKMFETKTASKEIISQTSLNRGEVLTLESIENLKQIKPVESKALLEQDVIQELVVSQNIVQESEEFFEEKFAPKTSTAEIQVEESKGLVITEITPEQIGNEEYEKSLPEKKKGRVTFDENINLTVSEIEVQESEGEYTSATKPLTHQSKINFEQLSAVQNTEITTNDVLDRFSQDKIDEQHAVKTLLSTTTFAPLISETTLAETEGTIEKHILPSTKSAKSDVTDVNTIATIQEITTNICEKPFDTVKYDTKKAVIEYVETNKAPVTQETTTSETLGQFKENKLTTHAANTEYDVLSELTVSSTQILEQVTNTTKLEKISDHKIIPKDNIAPRKAPMQEEIFFDEDVSTLKQPEKGKSTNVSNVTVEGREVPVIEEAQIEQSTIDLEISEQLKQSQANIDVITREAALTLVSESEQTVAKLELEKLAEFSKATTQFVSNIVALNTEQVTQETSKEFAVTSKEQHSAYPEIIPLEAKSVLNVISNEKEDVFDEKKKPEKRKANVEVVPLKSKTVEEHLTNQDVEELSTKKPKDTKAEVKISGEFTAITKETVEVDEKENIFDKKKTPEKRKANVEVVPLKSKTVQEHLTNQDVEEFTTDKPKDKKADVSLYGELAAITKETVEVDEKEDVFDRKKKPEMRQANVDVVLLKSKTVQEHLTNQDVEEFKTVKFENTQAEITLSGEYSALIKETIQADEKEDVFDKKKGPEKRKANVEIVALKSKTVQEHLTSQELEEFKTEKPDDKKAEMTLSGELSAVTRETVQVDEKEDVFDKRKIPEGKKASVEVVALKSKTVQENISTQNVEEFTTERFENKTVDVTLSGELTAVTEEMVQASEKEDVFDGKKTPEKRTASVDVVSLKSKTVEERLTNEDVKEFKTKKFEDSKAQMTISGELTAVSKEAIQPEEKEDIFDKKKVPESKKANVEVVPLKSTTVEEHLTTQDIGELKTKKPEDTTAEVTISELTAVTKQTVTVEEKEDVFDEKKRPEQRKANVDFVPLKSKTVEEHLTTQDVQELKTKKPEDTTAEVTLYGEYTAVTKETVQVDEKENVFDQKKTPEQRKANVEVVPLKSKTIQEHLSSQNVGELKTEKPEDTTAEVTLYGELTAVTKETVTVEEKEDVFDKKKTPDQRRANVDVVPLKSKSVQEHLTNEDVGELKTKKPEDTTAEIMISELTALTKQTVQPDEKEDVFDKKKAPDQKKANVEVVPLKSKTVQEHLTSQDVEEFKTTKAVDSKADVTITSELITVIKETIQTDEKEDIFDKKKGPETRKANVDFVSLKSKTIQEHLTSENFEELKTKKPEDTTAEVTITEMTALTKQTVQPDEKEDVFDEKKTPEQRKANVDVVPMKSKTVQEHLTSQDVQEFKTTKPDDTTAEVTLYGEFTAVTKETIQVEEKENIFSEKKAPETKKANVEIVPLKSKTIQEHLSSQNLGELKTEKPEDTTAEITISEFTALTKQTIQPDEKEDVFDKKKVPEQKKANVEVVPLKSKTVQEHLTSQDVEELKTKKPEDTTAEITISELTAVTKQTVQPDEKEDVFDKKKTPEQRKANVDVVPLKSKTIQEHITTQDVEELKTKKPEDTTAEVTLYGEFTAITKETIQPDEKEDVFDKKKAPEKRTASVDVVSLKSKTVEERLTHEDVKEFKTVKQEDTKAEMTISGELTAVSKEAIQPDEKEDVFDKKKVPESKKANVDVVPLKSKSVQEHLTNEDVGELKTEKPEDTTAEVTISELTAITKQTVTVEEKEDVFDKKKVPDQKKANVEVVPLKSKTVQEHLTSQDVEELKTKKPEDTTAEVTISELTAITKQTVTVEEKEEILDKTKAPEKRKASVDIIPLKSKTIQEHLTSENFEELKTKKPEDTTAEVTITELTAVTKQTVQPDEKENVFDKKKAPEKQKANVDVVPLKSKSIQEHLTTEDVEELKSKKPENVTAEITLSELTAVTKESVQPDEKENIFDKKKVPEKKKANVEVVPLKSKTVQEHLTTQDVEEFETEKPEDKKAEMTFTRELTAITKETLQVDEKEKPLDKKKLPEMRKASVDIVPLQSKTVQEHLTSQDVEDLKPEKPEDTKADVSISELTAVTKQTVQPDEKEDVFDKKKTPEKRKANVDVITHKSKTVEEQLTTQDLQELKTKKPEDTTAEVTISELAAVTRQTIQPDEKEDVFDEKKTPEKRKASIDVITLKSKTVEERLTTQDVQELKTKKPEDTTAEVTISEFTALTKQTIQPDEREDVFDEKKTPEKRRASIDVITLKSKTIQEHVITEGVKEFKSDVITDDDTKADVMTVFTDLKVPSTDTIESYQTTKKITQKKPAEHKGLPESIPFEDVFVNETEGVTDFLQGQLSIHMIFFAIPKLTRLSYSSMVNSCNNSNSRNN